MINTNQLREGNIIYDLSKGYRTYQTVNFENKGAIGVSADYFEGIPLTEKYIRRTGLERVTLSDSNRYTFKSKSRFSVTFEFNIPVLSFDGLKTGRPLPFLHDLQNTYWAITGEDLLIDLPSDGSPAIE